MRLRMRRRSDRRRRYAGHACTPSSGASQGQGQGHQESGSQARCRQARAPHRQHGDELPAQLCPGRQYGFRPLSDQRRFYFESLYCFRPRSLWRDLYGRHDAWRFRGPLGHWRHLGRRGALGWQQREQEPHNHQPSYRPQAHHHAHRLLCDRRQRALLRACPHRHGTSPCRLRARSVQRSTRGIQRRR